MFNFRHAQVDKICNTTLYSICLESGSVVACLSSSERLRDRSENSNSELTSRQDHAILDSLLRADWQQSR